LLKNQKLRDEGIRSRLIVWRAEDCAFETVSGGLYISGTFTRTINTDIDFTIAIIISRHGQIPHCSVLIAFDFESIPARL
jgi:hypothetical protein